MRFARIGGPIYSLAVDPERGPIRRMQSRVG
jgi:hypothetical protein